MCAGLTVFAALRLYLNTNAKKQQRVAVAGIGGLGHLALQFANKLLVSLLVAFFSTLLIDFG